MSTTRDFMLLKFAAVLTFLLCPGCGIMLLPLSAPDSLLANQHLTFKRG